MINRIGLIWFIFLHSKNVCPLPNHNHLFISKQKQAKNVWRLKCHHYKITESINVQRFSSTTGHLFDVFNVFVAHKLWIGFASAWKQCVKQVRIVRSLCLSFVRHFVCIGVNLYMWIKKKEKLPASLFVSASLDETFYLSSFGSNNNKTCSNSIAYISCISTFLLLRFSFSLFFFLVFLSLFCFSFAFISYYYYSYELSVVFFFLLL